MDVLHPAHRKSTAASQASHRCGVCNKIFERRDLRDRHKKRCIQSYSRPKRSKKRSCNACASSKLGCDMGYPACTRCASRSITCIYPPHIVQLQAQQQGYSADGEINTDLSPFELGMAEMHAIFTNQLTTESTQRSRTTTGSVVSEAESVRNPIGAQWQIFSQDDLMDDTHGASGDALFHDDDLESPRDNVFDLLGSFGMPGTNSTSASLLDITSNGGQDPLFQPVCWKPPLPFENAAPASSLQSSSDQSVFSENRSATSSQARDMRSEIPNLRRSPHAQQRTDQTMIEPPRQSECPFHKVGTDDRLVDLLKSYIQTMLHKGFYPPFVHHKLYKCVEGDVIESLANAFCALAAKNAAVPSSEGFVNTMISSERARLIKTFHSWGKSDIEGLAAVHAMSIYQIISLFDSNEEQARLAELQHPFYLKMARRLAQQFLLPEQQISPDTSEATWRKWLLLESLRRALLVVNIINTLGYRTQRLNGYYYEPLSDNLIMSLSAPAPECLWNARSARDWASQYSNLSVSDRVLSGMTMAQLRDMVDPRVAQSPAVPKLEFDDLSEFTRLVLTTLGVEVPIE